MNIIRTMRLILEHPGNRYGKVAALARFIRWQIASRLALGSIAVPFVNDTILLVANGMTGATGNIYNGLLEWEEMGFVLHFLRPEELFVDVGANVGAYSVMAAGAVGSPCVCIEPIESTFVHLRRNIAINFLDSRVELHNVGAGSEDGSIGFINNADTRNRVAIDGEAFIPVEVKRVDDLLEGRMPVLMKIDVEGFEPAVLAGASRTLELESLQAVIVEVNGQEKRYGFAADSVRGALAASGFTRIRYEPRTREIVRDTLDGDGNAIFVKNLEWSQDKVRKSPEYRTLIGKI
ncbi:FkbM family methyltransferase [Mesorhizobium sp. AA22]|uniref:FkbM family methyltransferase n=1 Tax=Mesorhizobium sp. AA22 TaxID=1854057 RepID=UPI0007EC5405|nr:FkbM family methyltransferase [Mesorhizobium sp. AA22]QIA24732.1 FkbM family methyltransferase [Mesorhizobium sp. AA22]